MKEALRRSDPEDFQLKWQTFLIDGFPEWRGAAMVASTQLIKTTARDVLQGMIHDFYFANGHTQSADHIAHQLEVFAFASNARVRDKKTGEIIGTVRSLKKKNAGKVRSQLGSKQSIESLTRQKRREARNARRKPGRR